MGCEGLSPAPGAVRVLSPLGATRMGGSFICLLTAIRAGSIKHSDWTGSPHTEKLRLPVQVVMTYLKKKYLCFWTCNTGVLRGVDYGDHYPQRFSCLDCGLAHFNNHVSRGRGFDNQYFDELVVYSQQKSNYLSLFWLAGAM